MSKILNIFVVLLSLCMFGCEKEQSSEVNEVSSKERIAKPSSKDDNVEVKKMQNAEPPVVESAFKQVQNALPTSESPEAKYMPKVAADTHFYAFYRDSDSKALVSFYEFISLMKAVVFSQNSNYGGRGPKLIERFLNKSLLINSTVNWCVFSCELNLSEQLRQLDCSSAALVVNVKHSSVELLESLLDIIDEEKSNLRDKVTVEMVEVMGRRAMMLRFDNNKVRITPYLMSIDDELLIVAGSRSALRNQMSLYCNNNPEKVKSTKVFSDSEVVMGVVVSDVGRICTDVEKNFMHKRFSRFNEESIALDVLNNLKYKNFGRFSVLLRDKGSNGINCEAKLVTNSETEAIEVYSIARTSRLITRSYLKCLSEWRKRYVSNKTVSPNNEEMLASVLDLVKINAEGRMVSVDLLIPCDVISVAISAATHELLREMGYHIEYDK